MSAPVGAPLRAFIAIEIPEALRRAIWAGMEQARALYPQGKWVSPANLHITVKFLGNVAQESVAGVSSRLGDACRNHRPFVVTLGGVGTFPGGARARVIWAGITNGGEETGHLAKDVDAFMERVGFQREARPFRAHLTVARAGDTGVSEALIQALRQIGAVEWGSFEVSSVALVQSILRPQGPLYRPISHHPLRGVAPRVDQ